MAVVKIEEIYLYISDGVPNAVENIQAAAFMDHAGIPFTRMKYNDSSEHANVLEPLNTWWADRLPPIDSFPFLTYVEVHDNIPARYSPVLYLKGLDDIKKIVDLYNATNV